MIFDYANPEVIAYLRLQGELLPRPEWGLYFWLLAALLALLWWWRGGDRGLQIACAAMAGSYLYSWRWTDEVFINLEHPWNLLHHGRFSFQAHAWVDGTVEAVYYLLLTPAAVTHSSLIRANYLLGLILALGHLLLLARWLRGFDARVRGAALVAFALFIPFVEVCSSGFGNALVSLIFFYAIVELSEGREGLWAAALLPLIRPDAVLYSGVAFFYALLLRRKIARPLLLGAAALGAYFCVYRLTYGHFVPTPMLFKSFHLSMLPLRALRPVCSPAVGWCPDVPEGSWLASPLIQALFFPSALVAWALLIASLFHDPGEPRPLKLVRLTLLPLAAIAWLYRFTALGYYPTLFRYYAPFLLMLAVLPLRYLASLLRPREAQVGRFVPALLAIACVVCGAQFSAHPAAHQGRAAGGTLPLGESERLNDFLFAGRFVDQLAPPAWRIGITEMATFSFMNDRQILDLWGYTNRDIATSKTCSVMGTRRRPDLLLRERPELVWWRTGVPGALYGINEIGSDEMVLATWDRGFDTLGDPREAVKLYDLFKLHHFGERTTLLLVRRDLSAALRERLEQQQFHEQKARPIDVTELSRYYQPFDQRDCS